MKSEWIEVKEMQGKTAKLLAILVVGAMFMALGFSHLNAQATDGEGDMTNQSPYAAGTDNDGHMLTNTLEYDNSGSDVLTLYFTFKDNNSEADVTVTPGVGQWLELIVYYEPSADNDGFDFATDTKVASFDLSLTQTAGDCFIDSNGGATNGSNDDGTTTDGYFEIEDENDDDDNFEFTIPGSWATSDYYAAQINFTDEGSEVDSYTPNFVVSTSITASLGYADGTWGAEYWGEWSAAPTDSNEPDDPDAASIGWLVVNNTGSDPAQQFTVSFSAENFTGTSYARWINIDFNVRWTYYEVQTDPGGDADPDDVDWEDGNWTTADDADGDYTFTFTEVGIHMWVMYELAQVTEDDGTDEKPVVGHTYDNVLRDDQYTCTFTWAAV